MQSLRLWNVRSFEDTKDVALRKLTLLVGKNASGKSTFARWLPLLRQSVIRRSSTPLLWYVDGGDVDFGSTADAVRRGAHDFGFAFKLDAAKGGELALPPLEDLRVEVELSATGSTVASVRVERLSDSIAIGFNGNNIVAAIGADDQLTPIGLTAETGPRNTLPGFYGSPAGTSAGAAVARDEWAATPLHKELIATLRRVVSTVHSKPLDSRVHALRWLPPGEFEEQLRAGLGPYLPTYATSDVSRVRQLVAIREAVSCLSGLDFGLRSEASLVGYVGPFRKSPSRYERVSDIATDLVDHTGANLPMVLRSMSADERRLLSEWLTRHLGFGVALSGEEHVQLRIVEPSGRESNILDTGFGYSQVLPVAVALWRAQVGVGRTLVLEQPELHLHPALQTQLGRLLAAVVSRPTPHGSAPLRLIIETHSEALLNAVGEAIEFDRLDRDDVSIALFERDEVSGISTVRQGQFDSSGRLADWPRGFLAG